MVLRTASLDRNTNQGFPTPQWHIACEFSVAYEHDTQWIGIGKREYYKPSLRFSSPLPPNITLFSDRKLDTLALRQRDPGLWALADDKNVGYPGYA